MSKKTTVIQGAVQSAGAIDLASAQSMDAIAARMRILGEPLRLRLLHHLQLGECSVTQMAAHLGTTQPNVSKHLKILLEAGLVHRRQQKNSAFYSVADNSPFAAVAAIAQGLAAAG